MTDAKKSIIAYIVMGGASILYLILVVDNLYNVIDDFEISEANQIYISAYLPIIMFLAMVTAFYYDFRMNKANKERNR